ncbi:hypothetical protein Bca52824_057878 [Brassica carinata]|uniref:Uncharacterized protein n=1 Tax=Brassica carinata TaxID=52824 RepID=A0A8X7QT94_BRACI|nr:hypothetical protein Bca52824_057878 [Brassica carinata]
MIAYGVERIDREVSTWIKSSSDDEENPEMPFIATWGHDSVVKQTLETSDLDDYQVSKILRDSLEAIGAKAMVV